MSQRFDNGTLSSEDVTETNYTNLHNEYTKNDVKHNEIWVKDDLYDINPNNDFNIGYLGKDNKAFSDGDLYAIPSVRSKKRDKEDTFRSPNICLAKGRMGGEINCNCNRHFQLNVPDLRNNEISTSL